MSQEDKGIKYWLVSGGLVLSFGLLLTAILRLMVIKGGYYKELARDNKIAETIIPAARGQLLDRKGRVLAKSIYQYYKLEDGVKLYEESGDYKGERFEGKDLAYELKRQYFFPEAAGMVTGYVSVVNEAELKKKEKCGQRLSNKEMIGRGGIEEWFDCQLRGKDGERLVEIDATGKYVRELGRIEPEAGKDLELSLDGYWQDKVYQLVKDRKAAVIISEPQTGKVLVAVSSPAFDANAFSFTNDSKLVSGYLNDELNLPMLNRVTAAKYHPGSVFKIVVATAGLETGVIDEKTTFEDTGVIKIGEYSFANWLWTKNGGTDGMVNIVKALKRSNDIFFYRLGENLGSDRIKVWAEKFGFGQVTGIEIPGEVRGLVPDDKWKRETRGERWFLGNTYHLSIGQGDLEVTPLQINQMTNVIGANGMKCRLTLDKNKKPECTDLKISQKTLELIKEGMRGACASGGTAWPLFNFKTKLACKTGTAEVGDGSKDTHAWLTALAPADDPQISITVMIERGGEGSDEAAPIVGDILKEWFDEPGTVVSRRVLTGVKQ